MNENEDIDLWYDNQPTHTSTPPPFHGQLIDLGGGGYCCGLKASHRRIARKIDIATWSSNKHNKKKHEIRKCHLFESSDNLRLRFTVLTCELRCFLKYVQRSTRSGS